MTDLEADLLIANAKIKQLEQQLAISQRREQAAVEDVKRVASIAILGGVPPCDICKNTCDWCENDHDPTNFDYRGPQEAGKGETE